MPERKRKSPSLGSAPDALRAAIEQTYEATAGSASQTKDRAIAIVEELAERGKKASKLIDRGREEADRALDEVHSAIDKIQRLLR